MTPTASTARPALRVIDGDAQAARRQAGDVPLPEAPVFTASELAGELAEMYVMALLDDLSPEELANPHARVRIDPVTEITLHDLLCELRNLPWFDARAVLAPCPDREADPWCEAARRRATRWNADGQLTLRTLFRGGIASLEDATGASGLLARDVKAGEPNGPAAPPPGAARMSDWVDWCARHSGAGLALPGQSAPLGTPASFGALTTRIFETPPARVFHTATLQNLATGGSEEAGEGLHWEGPQILALMAEVEYRSRSAALRRLTRMDRLSRPAVIAARMTVYLAREERQEIPGDELYRAAADELAQYAPNLLTWVSRANLQRRRFQRFEQNLFLPLCRVDDPVHPSDVASHVIVAAALATVMKPLLAKPTSGALSLVGGAASTLTQSLDLMVANTAAARVRSGGYYPAENHQDQRLGQCIALQVLREALEDGNRSATLSLRDFDGRAVQLVAHPRHFGRGLAELRTDGEATPWPTDAVSPTAHLTAVV